MSLDGNWIRKNESREFKEEVFSDEVLKKEEFSKQQLRDSKKEMFDNLVNSGIDRALAYQVAYGISHEDAIRLVNGESYLVSHGFSLEMASEINSLSTEENRPKRR